jgi:hypothetical protein
MEANLDSKHLSYFKELLEGKATVSFSAYLKINQAALTAQLPRAQFLRLKFDCTDEMQKILESHGVEFEANEAAIRREIYLRNVNPADLDESGRLKPATRSALFEGAVALFESGKEDEARLTVLRLVDQPKKMSSNRVFDELEDLEYFSEIEMKFGNVKTGLFFMGIIASFERQFSRIDDIIIRAREALAATGSK